MTPARNDSLTDSALRAHFVPASHLFDAPRWAASEPLRRLMFAVLKDAILRFERNVRAQTVTRRRDFLEAERWLFRKDGGVGIFSFENVCHVLAVEPYRLRRALSQWRATALTAEAWPLLLIGRRSRRPSRRKRAVAAGAPHTNSANLQLKFEVP